MTGGSATIASSPTGYCDAMSYPAGATVTVYATGSGPIRLGLARLSGEAREGRAGVGYTPVVAARTVDLFPQSTRTGSLLIIDDPWPRAFAGRLELSFSIRDHAPAAVVSSVAAWRWRGIVLRLILVDGALRLAYAGEVETVAVGDLESGWNRIRVIVDADARVVEVHVGEVLATTEIPVSAGEAGDDRLVLGSDLDATFGCLDASVADLMAREITSEGTSVIGRWDLGVGDRSVTVADMSGHGRHGRMTQHPERGVPGPGWTRREVDPRLAPAEFTATRFHRDDVTDAGWIESARVPLPANLPSGIYAVTLESSDGVDHIPFVVRDQHRRGRVAFLLSTFTYMAYANADLGDRIDYAAAGISGRQYLPGLRDRQIHENRAVQGSLYDVHTDGFGRCFSGLRRPIFNFRADFESAVQQAPRHLGADLLLLTWLQRSGFDVDVISDHDLHRDGVTALDGYAVVVTSSHPEYVTDRILDALEEFQSAGGGLMYLGGNGFYWVTAADDADAAVIEVRRGNAGTRTWDSPAGESHLFFTGELGGLWRHRGRSPNSLVGIGMASQGWDERATAFVAGPEVIAHPDTAWLYEGLRSPARFGAQGLVMDGASGDELDRWDPAFGSPAEVTRVATSEPHSSHYMLVHEDVLMTQHGLGGDVNADVRSDIVWYRTPSGAPVFSVGSITWAGAVAYDDFDNDCARLTSNALRRMVNGGHQNG